MYKVKKTAFMLKKISSTIGMMLLLQSTGFAQEQRSSIENMKEGIQRLIKPKEDQSYTTIKIPELSNFDFQPDPNLTELPVIQPNTSGNSILLEGTNTSVQQPSLNASTVSQREYTMQETINIALQRNPEIAQVIANLSSQNANIDVAKSRYYPQLSAGMNSGDLTSGDRGRMLYTIEANQLLYDFGKVRASVNIQEALLQVEQGNLLINIDKIATDTARSVLGILRYRELVRIAQEQVKGVTRLHEMAVLRARAGISSNADPVQAQSYVEYAKSYLITQQNALKQEEQKLRTLLGFNVENLNFSISPDFVKKSGVYSDLELNLIPAMMVAKSEIEVAQFQKKQTQLSRYPTVNLVGSVDKALNGIHPNTGKSNDMDSSIGISMSSNFYQGGAVGSQIRAASFAEAAAQAKLNSTYLNILDVTRTARENIVNTEQQIAFLQAREKSTAQTRELYEEQYKLGKRSILDLMSSEQSYHSSRAEREIARYTIYDTIANFINVAGKSRDIYQLNNIKIQGFEIQP